MHNSVYVWACMALMTCLPVFGQKYSNEFLAIGVGGRAQGMGSAQVASASGTQAGFWNPAGLTTVPMDMQAAAMHSEWFGGIGKYDYFSVAMPIQERSRYVGLSFIRFGVDGIPNTLTLYEDDGTVNYNNVTEFTAADYALYLTYAQPIAETNLHVGGSAKIVHRQVGPFANSWGFGVDLGAQYRLPQWTFGLMLKDITTTFNAWQFNFTEEEKEVLSLTNNEIPIQSMEITRPSVQLGAAYTKRFKVGKQGTPGDGEATIKNTLGVTVEANVNLTTDGKRNTLVRSNAVSLDPLIGAEFDYNRVIFLRAGMNNIQQVTDFQNKKVWTVQPSFGVGVRIYKFYVDYALTNLGGQSGALQSHIVSLKLDINYDYIKRTIINEG